MYKWSGKSFYFLVFQSGGGEVDLIMIVNFVNQWFMIKKENLLCLVSVCLWTFAGLLFVLILPEHKCDS